ncbi:MAG: hypothetical protein MZU84_05650 [Sphingobacterium sp.]|nr:hypothetical protein [Sphingobacterium sp.]
MRPTLSELGEYDGTALDGVQDHERDRDLPHQRTRPSAPTRSTTRRRS